MCPLKTFHSDIKVGKNLGKKVIEHQWQGNMSWWHLNTQQIVSAAHVGSAKLYVQYIQKELQEWTVKHYTSLYELLAS